MNTSDHETITYTFDNLIIGSQLLGEARRLKITVPKSFSTQMQRVICAWLKVTMRLVILHISRLKS